MISLYCISLVPLNFCLWHQYWSLLSSKLYFFVLCYKNLVGTTIIRFILIFNSNIFKVPRFFMASVIKIVYYIRIFSCQDIYFIVFIIFCYQYCFFVAITLLVPALFIFFLSLLPLKL